MKKKKNEMSRLLVHDGPLLLLPKLAEEIGLNEAIFLQQVHYWLQKTKYIYDGRRWTCNTYVEWGRQFPFWSVRTVRRIIEKLEESGILLSDNYNKSRLDKTKWYSIEYGVLSRMTSSFAQNVQLQYPSNEVEAHKLSNSNGQFTQSNTRELTENTTEIVVVEEKEVPKLTNEGIPTSQSATSEPDADSSQKKISLAEYRQKVIDKYLRRRSQGFGLSAKDTEALEAIIAEKIPLRIALQGIDKAFDEFKPAHERDKINSLNYCVQIIFRLHNQSKPRTESQEPSPVEQSTVSDEELQELLSRMKSGGNKHEEFGS